MPYHNIDATLTQEDLEAIKQAIAIINERLPFLVNLTATERRTLYKMGDRRLSFVQNSFSAAQNNQTILPASFDMKGYANDYHLARDLTELLMQLRQLTEQVDDTLTAVGSEAMTSSLVVYDYVKTAAKHTPGLKAISEQLGTLFKSIRSRSPQADVDSAEPANAG